MKNKAKLPLASVILGVLVLTTLDLSAAVAPHSEGHMEEAASLIVEGEVVSLSSRTQKSKADSSLFARDRIFKITIKVASVAKGKGIKAGEQLVFEAWQPSTRLPLLPGPQGHQPVPGKGDLVKTYLLYNKKTMTYHPFMPNGIRILREARKVK